MKSNYFELVRYSDANFGGVVINRKYTSDFVFEFGYAAITWKSKNNCMFHCKQLNQSIFQPIKYLIWLNQISKQI